MLYIDNKKGRYKFVDFNDSHNHLLIRRYKDSPFYEGTVDFIPYNIDIYFYGVLGLNIQTSFDGINIDVVKKEPGQIAGNEMILQYTFKICDASAKIASFIDAVGFKIFHDEFLPNISSLRDAAWNKEGKVIYSSEQDTERFKKSL